MTDTNPRPWRDRITVEGGGDYCLVDGGEFHRLPNASLRSLLDEAHDLAAEVERLRALLANPTDGPLRVERAWHGGCHLVLTDNGQDIVIESGLPADLADAIEAQLAARPVTHDLPDGVQPWTAAPIEIDGVPVVGVAMGDVVQGLSDDEWLRAYYTNRWQRSGNADAGDVGVYLLGRKPTPDPPTVTVELPQDVAERYGTERVQVDDHEVVLDSIAKALGR